MRGGGASSPPSIIMTEWGSLSPLFSKNKKTKLENGCCPAPLIMSDNALYDNKMLKMPWFPREALEVFSPLLGC